MNANGAAPHAPVKYDPEVNEDIDGFIVDLDGARGTPPPFVYI